MFTFVRKIGVGMMLVIMALSLSVQFAGESFAQSGADDFRWEKARCVDYRADWPAGKNFSRDLTYDFHCGWLEGKTGGIPTGSLTLPEENAQLYDSGIVATDAEGNVLGLVGLIVRITNWALGFVGVLAMVAFVYGGYLMVANFGNDELTGKGKKVIISSSIGIVVILLSFTAVNALLGAGGGQPSDALPTQEGVSQDYVNATLVNMERSMVELFDGLDSTGDLCPGTPRGKKVNQRGCSQGEFPPDSDGDGVINIFDQDDDGDGTSDDSDGDSDDDGVSNGSDLCPDTLLFHVARPYTFAPYAELIANGSITRDDVLDGHGQTGSVPLILPYVKPTGLNVAAGYTQEIRDADLRGVGCAAYEGSQDSDGDGVPNDQDPDDDNDGEDDVSDPDDDNDGVADRIDSGQGSGGGARTPVQSRVTNDQWTAYVGDTLILDLRNLFADFGATTSMRLPFILQAFAQEFSPNDYIWIQNPTDLTQATLSTTEFETRIVARSPGRYRFSLYLKNDNTTPIENIFGSTEITVDVLAVTTIGSNTTPAAQYLAEFFDSFRRDVFLTCSRLPQTLAVRQLCDTEDEANPGSLIQALYDFGNAPDEANMTKLFAEFQRLSVIVQQTPKVIARMTASPTKGSAPLAVAFDATGSVDPFDVGIPDSNYRWCVGYTSINQALNCESPGQPYEGPFVSHVFEEPGVYIARLQVSTAQTIGDLGVGVGLGDEDAQAAMDGYATVRIVVDPPTANIRLAVEASGETTDVTRLTSHKVTGSQARAGIAFITEGTTDYTRNGVTHITSSSWDYGDGTAEEDDGLQSRKEHSYDTLGTYSVRLEMKDDRLNVSRKFIDIIVSDVVAALKVLPENLEGDVSTQFTFDASDSRVEGGQVSGYEWEIYPITKNIRGIPVATSQSNPNLRGPVVNFVFPGVGEYDVEVSAIGDGGEVDTTSKRILVSSRAPTARFSWRVLDKKKPATVLFDASGSSDPDPNTDLSYTWFVNGSEVELVGNDKVPMIGNYTFDAKGEHRVELLVTDRPDGSGVSSRLSEIVKIDSTLDVDFSANTFSSRPDEDITFSGMSSGALGYFWDFGDGVREYVTENEISHGYKQAGSYRVVLTVDNELGEENSVSKKVRIADKDSPIAIGKITIGGNEIEPDERICGTAEGILVDRLTTVNFDGSESVNRDGTSRGLRYEWNFDDGELDSSRSTVHKFPETTIGSDCYNVTLTVTDRITGEEDISPAIGIRVENALPTLNALNIVRPTSNVTPVILPLSLAGARDTDGRILEYTWYYYDVSNPGKKLDIHVTSEPKTTFTIGPRDREGTESNYHIHVTMKDNDDGFVSNEEILGKSQVLTIINGPSLAPDVKYVVDKSRVKVGEKIAFTSKTTDPLGRFIPSANFKWDFYGDGRYDRVIVGPEVTFAYDRPGTYTPRLKVTQEGLSETFESEIIVEATTEKPEAAYLFIKSGNKITFINNSTVDPQLDITDLRYAWDFDVDLDSDGNGIPDDDIDSAQVNPSNIYEFSSDREISVKLMVTDIMGQSDSVVRKIFSPKEEEIGALGATIQDKLQSVLLTDPEADQLDKKVYLKNTEGEISFIMKRSTGKIKEYHLDLNVFADSDGDGIRDNDIDNSLHASLDTGDIFTHTYSEDSGAIRAQLTVVDFQGRRLSSSVDIVLNESGMSPFESSFDPDSIFVLSDVPVVQFTIEEDILLPGEAITFDASSSSFPEEGIAEYQWDFNSDGTIDESGTTPVMSYEFDDPGQYEVTLSVFSDSGLFGEYTETISVRDLSSDPIADFDFTTDDLTVTFNNLSTFDTIVPDNSLSYAWEFISLEDDEILQQASSEEGAFAPVENVTPLDGRIQDASKLAAGSVEILIKADSEVFDSNDQHYNKVVRVPKFVSAPKGQLDLERKVVDSFLVGSSKPLFLSRDVSVVIDLNFYEGIEEPVLYLYTLPEKNWVALSGERDGTTLRVTTDKIGIFGLTDVRSSEVNKIETVAVSDSDLPSPEVSTLESPEITFDDYGTYKVTLTVSDIGERSDSLIQLVTLERGVVSAPVVPEVAPEELETPEIETPEEPLIDEVIVSEETLDTPDEEQAAESQGGGLGFVMIIIGIVLFLLVVVTVLFVFFKIKDQLAHHEGVMSSGFSGPPGTAPKSSPAQVAPPVEVVEKKPEAASTPAEKKVETTPKNDSSDVKNTDAPKSSPEKGATPEGGSGPVPDWLKRK